MDNAGLKKAFGNALRREGFTRKGGDWYIRGDDTIVVINLQPNDFRSAWYVNVGVWIRTLGDELWPKSHKCQVQIRVPRLWPLRMDEIDALFDLECGSGSDDERAAALSGFVTQDLAPACRAFLERKSLVDAIKGDEHFWVMLTAYAWLGLEPPG